MKKIVNTFLSVVFVTAVSACNTGEDDANVIAAAKAGYDAFKIGDMETWAATQANDVIWKTPKGFPYGGTYVGSHSVIENVFTPILQLWPDFKVEPIQFFASGNTVFIKTKMTAGGMISDSIHMAVIRDGKYTEFQVFDDAGYMMGSAKNLSDDALPNSDHTSSEWQVAAYSSAAPHYIGDSATVIGSNGEILREGSNGWTCLSLNPRPFPKSGWKNAHDAMPGCGDEEGMKWMDAALAQTKPDLERDTFIWMLQGDVGEDNTKMGVLNKAESTPGQWIESGPHLMLMPKDPATLEKFHADFTKGEPYIMMPGSDYAHLMIPVTGYYDYQQESSPLTQ